MAATHIGITANISKPNAREILTQLRSNLLRSNLQVSIEKETACLLDDPTRDDSLELRALAGDVDLLIVLGGDDSSCRTTHHRSLGTYHGHQYWDARLSDLRHPTGGRPRG